MRSVQQLHPFAIFSTSNNIKKYEECLNDLERALNFPISITQKIKYLCRKVECLVAIDKKAESKNSAEEIKLLLQEDDISCDLKTKTLKKLNEVFSKDYTNKKHMLLPRKGCVKYISSKDIVCASDAVKFAYTPKDRLHVVAARDIKTGEVLHNEKPYVVTPLDGNIYTHCSHCFNFTANGIPCRSCAYAIYCSNECTQEALEKYHDIECKLIRKVWFGHNKCFMQFGDLNSRRLLCLRLLVQAVKEEGSIEALKEIVKDIEECKGIYELYYIIKSKIIILLKLIFLFRSIYFVFFKG